MKIAGAVLIALALIAPQASAAPADLADDARRAASILASRQQPPGYWLTTWTGGRRFDHPVMEMNTYLTAVIADLLAPTAERAGLGRPLARARRQIASQIEDTGLVRYYGRADVPTTACVISPDADDTALAWRFAPRGNLPLLQKALEALEQYRTRDGLYRTWLAPRSRFQCIDFGKDPNPADVGIQMHMLMFFAEESPGDGRALCAALGSEIDDDRIWVYYRMTPLIPILRQADLRKAGCALPLPPSRLRTNVPGQEDWITAALALSRVSGSDGGFKVPPDTIGLLRKLARNNFAEIRQSPPLLYHNDMTASTPRFYWSEEFGYALWLRLYFATLQQG